MLEPHLPGRKDAWGGIAQDNSTFINAVFWILRTVAPWRDLPPDYGDWKNTHRRFCRWRDKDLWEAVLEVFVDDPAVVADEVRKLANNSSSSAAEIRTLVEEMQNWLNDLTGILRELAEGKPAPDRQSAAKPAKAS